MAAYYVNKSAQPNGDHEVHVLVCARMPEPDNRLYLGDFDHCRDAVQEAKKHYAQSNGCTYCCFEGHLT